MGSAGRASLFSDLETIAPDPHYFLKEQYAADDNDNKIILGSGVYRDDNNEPWILPTIETVCIHPLRIPQTCTYREH